MRVGGAIVVAPALDEPVRGGGHVVHLEGHPEVRADPPADLDGVDQVHLRGVGDLQRRPTRVEDDHVRAALALEVELDLETERVAVERHRLLEVGRLHDQAQLPDPHRPTSSRPSPTALLRRSVLTTRTPAGGCGPRSLGWSHVSPRQELSRCSPRCWSPIAARSRSGRSARPSSSGRARWRCSPTRTAGPSTGSRPTRPTRSASAGTRCGPTWTPTRSSRSRCGPAPTRSTPATASSARTRAWPRPVPRPASPSSAPAPTC